MTAAHDRLVNLTDAEREMIQRLLRQRDLRPRVRERLEMVKAAALGYDLVAIAQWTGRSDITVRHWLGRFRPGGLPALADAPRPGRPVTADDAYLAALEASVASAPPALGLSFDVWTSPRLSAYLAEQTGVRISPGWLRALLARPRFACGRPQHTRDHLQDPDEVAACEAELAQAGEKGGGGAGALRVPS